MKTSDKGIELIKQFEGFSSTPYLCPAGVWTIGYGTTRYPDGRKVSQHDKPITEAEATKLLADTLVDNETGVLSLIEADLMQHEFDALVSFAYNLGLQNLKTSTLRKRINEGDYIAAAREFDKWVKAKGKVLPGLVSRRKAEQAMFLGHE